MIRIAVEDVVPGMKLARDVKLPDGKLLLLAGFTLKPLYMRKLEAFKIRFVTVEEDQLEPVEECSEEKLYKQARETVENVFTLIRGSEEADITPVKSTVNGIVLQVLKDESVMLQLTGIRDIDSYTFLHSVDVCIYTTIIGKRMGYGKEQLLDLGIGSILHDIGKCKMPLEILQKPGSLSEYEFQTMKQHTVLGCDIMKSTFELKTKIANIAFQHHEKWDGSGYPLGVKSDMIDTFSRITTVADIYDALTADRIYKKKILPHKAAEYIKRNSGILFDPYIANLFISNIAVYAEGVMVLLNSGEVGTIVSGGEINSARQKVSVFANKSGPPILNPYIIDLSTRPDLEIVEVFV